MSKFIKVAIIEPVGGHGGMDYYDFGLCEGLVEAGVDVVLHTCDKTEKNDNQRFEVRHTYTGIYGVAPAWKRGFRYVMGSINAILSSVFEGRRIVHFHFFHVNLLALMNILLARVTLRTVVITAHDVESFVAALEVPFMSRFAYRLAHGVVAHNQFCKDEVIRCLSVPPHKVSVIASGNYLHVTGKTWSTQEAKAKLGISKEAKVLLFFGQIKQVKRLDLLLMAMPDILKVSPNVVLLIAGRPWKTTFSEYQHLIDKLDIGGACLNHIRFIPDDDLPVYYNAADLVVLPYERIYQSAVVLMAMSYGKAVLVSDLPSMVELIEDKKNGFIFKEGDVQSLVENVIRVTLDDDTRESVAKQGLLCMQNNYSWDKIGKETKQLYSEYSS